MNPGILKILLPKGAVASPVGGSWGTCERRMVNLRPVLDGRCDLVEVDFLLGRFVIPARNEEQDPRVEVLGRPAGSIRAVVRR